MHALMLNRKKKSQPLLTFHIIAIWKKKREMNGIKPWEMSMRVGQVGRQGLFGVVTGYRVKGQDCWPPHWLSTGRRRSSSTCLATSMVSSRSKSPSASNIESLLPQDTEWSQTTLRQAGSTSPKRKKPSRSNKTLFTHTMHVHTEHMFKGRVDSHRWVYAVGVRVTDGCWRGAVIHIGWIPTCWIWIGCSKPAHTHKAKIKADESMFSSCLSNYPQRVFQASLHHYGHSLCCGRTDRGDRQGAELTN